MKGGTAMTSSNTCRPIRPKNDRPGQGTTPCRHAQIAGYSLPCSRKYADKPYPEFSYDAGRDFDNQLRTYENLARRQYLRLLNNLSLEKLPAWFEKMLSQRLLPTLHRIGFDEPISKGLFEIASSSWCHVGPANEKIIAFHPNIDREIEDVRQGVSLKAGNASDPFKRFTGSGPTAIFGTMNKDPSPDHLFELLDNIATPWIVLPRAFRFLKRDQCRYLTAYLAAVEHEKSESLLMLFGRITVEFVGNFSLKFADSCHRPDHVAKLLFYGYAALFWKTLRCPPKNLENSAVFDIFFNWLTRLVRTTDYFGRTERQTMHQMLKMKTKIFPCPAEPPCGMPGGYPIARFLVTLRHGCMGTVTVLRYFGIDQFSGTRKTMGRFQSLSFQKDLIDLLNTIQLNYHLESKRTRGYIRQFMGCIRWACEILQPGPPQSNWKFWIRRFNNI
jgi:hypothetical protein